MLTIFLLLFCWGAIAIALGAGIIAGALLVDQAMHQIKLGNEHKDD